MSETDDLCEDLSGEVYDLLACIKDPEFPDKTLGNLKTSHVDEKNPGGERMVVNEDDITVEMYGKTTGPKKLLLTVYYTPTVQHCSLTSLIGLCIYKKLDNEFPITAHTVMFDFSDKKSFYQFGDDSTEDNLKYSVFENWCLESKFGAYGHF